MPNTTELSLEPDIHDELSVALEFIGTPSHRDVVERIGVEWGFAGPGAGALYGRLSDALHADCKPCVHAVIYGWWGPPLLKELNAHTHCNKCHRSWRGTKQAHCTVCHEHFSSAEAASKHWVNDRHVHPSDVKGRDGGPRFCLSEEEQEFGSVWTLCRHQVAAA